MTGLAGRSCSASGQAAASGSALGQHGLLGPGPPGLGRPGALLIRTCCLALQCVPKERLPALYLMDSIIKNVREPYKSLFSKRLEHVSTPEACSC